MTCVDLNLFGAIHTWALGQKLDGMCIRGFNAVWIARAAKAMAFLSAGTLLIDIFGPKKVEIWAVALRRRIARAGRGTKTISTTLLKAELPPGASAHQLYVVKTLALTIFVLVIALMLPAVRTSISDALSVQNFGEVVKIFHISVLQTVIISSLLILASGVALFLASSLIVALSRKMLRRDFCERARVVAAVVFVIAFSVDMLMS